VIPQASATPSGIVTPRAEYQFAEGRLGAQACRAATKRAFPLRVHANGRIFLSKPLVVTSGGRVSPMRIDAMGRVLTDDDRLA